MKTKEKHPFLRELWIMWIAMLIAELFIVYVTVEVFLVGNISCTVLGLGMTIPIWQVAKVMIQIPPWKL